MFGHVRDSYSYIEPSLAKFVPYRSIAVSSARMNRADKVKRAHGSRSPATFLFYIRPLIKESGSKRRAINAFALPLKSLPRTFDDDTPWNRTSTILNSSSQPCHQLRIRSEKGENSKFLLRGSRRSRQSKNKTGKTKASWMFRVP